MLGFDALYKQTVTLFNRVSAKSGEVFWYPTVINGVHLITTKSSSWSGRAENESDDVRLHIQYTPSGSDALIKCADDQFKKWLEPKVWRRLPQEEKLENLTFAFGDAEVFDFFVEGVFAGASGPISDSAYERKGFYNFMNSQFDGVYAITSVSRYNLIPHFEIMAR